MTIFLILIIVICSGWMGFGLHAYLSGDEWAKTSEDMEFDFTQELGDAILDDIKKGKYKKKVSDDEKKAL